MQLICVFENFRKKRIYGRESCNTKNESFKRLSGLFAVFDKF